MKFITLYNTDSNLFRPNGHRQPKNHLGVSDFEPLCGVRNVQWMGGIIELEEAVAQNGICKKCMKAALKLNSEQKDKRSVATDVASSNADDKQK